jgi:hypothetical protein
MLPFISRSQKLVDSMEKAMRITGLAVPLTTPVFASQHSLDLFHALAIFHLVGLVGFSFVPTSRREGGSTGGSGISPRAVPDILYYASMLGFPVFMIYVCATAPEFGRSTECNAELRYLLSGIEVSATNIIFRILFLLLLLAYSYPPPFRP